MYVKGDMGLGQGEIIFVLTGEGNWDKLKMVLYLCLQENGTEGGRHGICVCKRRELVWGRSGICVYKRRQLEIGRNYVCVYKTRELGQYNKAEN